MSDEDERSRYTKRALLKATGGLAAGISMPGLASAQGRGRGRGRGSGQGRSRGRGQGDDSGRGGGPPSRARNTCSDGLVRLAKYEVEGGNFVYEKDSEFLSVGDAFDLTVTATKDGGEVLAFDFRDPNSVFDVREISVKTGEGVFKKTLTGDGSSPGGDADDGTYFGSFDARNYDEGGPVQAISNVLLCSKVFWQVDFGLGPAPTGADYGEAPDSTLLRAALGDSTDEQITVTDDGLLASNSETEGVSITSNPAFGVHWNAGTVDIAFQNNQERVVHLVSFERPGPFRGRGEFDAQERFDATTTTAANGTLTVDIPTPGDYS